MKTLITLLLLLTAVLFTATATAEDTMYKPFVVASNGLGTLDEKTRQLTLYQFKTCPFCIKVRRTMKQLALNIELRDAQKKQTHRQELIEGGGEAKVPCLKIVHEDGRIEWLYESDDIISYLQNSFA